jgi:hypothetical protein
VARTIAAILHHPTEVFSGTFTIATLVLRGQWNHGNKHGGQHPSSEDDTAAGMKHKIYLSIDPAGCFHPPPLDFSATIV